MPASATATAEPTSSAIDAFVRLIRAHAAVTRELSSQLSADHGLSINAYELLLRLSRAEDQRMRRVDLAGQLLLTASGITRILDGLEREGLVAREECVSDRRVTYAVLTESGREKLQAASGSHTSQIRRLLEAAYTDEELHTLVELLDRLPGVDPDGEDAACGVDS